LKKAELEKEISDALAESLSGVYYFVQVKEYRCDKNYQSSITLEVQMYINGDISDLPSGYKEGEPESDCIMSILESKKKMNWKEFEKTLSELKKKGYSVGWNTYYKGKPLTNEISWKVAPNKFTYEIVRVDRYD
jgi:hypothetical protein